MLSKDQQLDNGLYLSRPTAFRCANFKCIVRNLAATVQICITENNWNLWPGPRILRRLRTRTFRQRVQSIKIKSSLIKERRHYCRKALKWFEKLLYLILHVSHNLWETTLLSNFLLLVIPILQIVSPQWCVLTNRITTYSCFHNRMDVYWCMSWAFPFWWLRIKCSPCG